MSNLVGRGTQLKLFLLIVGLILSGTAFASSITGGGEFPGSADASGYGSLENSSYATTTSITGANTYVKVDFETAGTSTDELTPSATTDDITVVTAGRFQALLSASLSLDDADEDIDVCIANNGTCIDSCQTSLVVGLSKTNINASCLVVASASDAISILIRDTTAAAGQYPVAATFSDANFHMEALGAGDLVGTDDTQTLTNKTINGDDNTITNIARSSIKAGSANHVVINDGSGFLSSEASLAISRGGTGANTALGAINAISPLTTKGDIMAHTGADNVRLPTGSNGQCLKVATGETSGLEWGACATGAGGAILNDDTGPPVADISWDGFDIYNIDEIRGLNDATQGTTVTIRGGNTTGGSNNGGDVALRPGTSAGGIFGLVLFKDANGLSQDYAWFNSGNQLFSVANGSGNLYGKWHAAIDDDGSDGVFQFFSAKGNLFLQTDREWLAFGYDAATTDYRYISSRLNGGIARDIVFELDGTEFVRFDNESGTDQVKISQIFAVEKEYDMLHVATPSNPATGRSKLYFKSDGNLYRLNSAGTETVFSSGGEANTASNQGTGGVGVFDNKDGVDLELRNVNAGSSKITVTLDAANKEVDIDVDESNVDHDSLSNFVANEHVDHTSVSITAGDGLSGGGDISTTRTIDVDINSESSVATLSASDELLISDVDDSNNIKKTTVSDIVNAGTGREIYIDTTQTTDGSDTNIRVVDLNDDDIVQIIVDCLGIKDDGSKVVGSRRQSIYFKDGAAVIARVGAMQTNYQRQTGGSPNYTTDITDDGSDSIEVVVTGAASETAEWKCVTEVIRHNASP